ncbi:Pyruvate/Phosphoenolpyruvate kinase [Pleurostoma richardsiae]|uniref:Pyruvate/Phosphoenolpyruvate kinase n=1 Tax=Pleurostoma richardsiae TaxID=41990 RepID=A0AA38VJM5_9PEZI|nr:Pyruvate/Phosphoenolpyruvate kinase [Pleurostoma richardsiae]
MFENKLYSNFDDGRLTTGFGIKLVASHDIVALAKTAGYDTIFLDLQHSTISVSDAGSLCSASLLAGITPFVRVPTQCGSGYVQRILDGGAMGIAFPKINTVEEAEEAIMATKFPPRGNRSHTSIMPHFESQHVGPKDMVEQLDQSGSVVIILVETLECLDNVNAIARMDGVDALMVSATDLSLELGVLGDWDHKRFADALMAVAMAASDCGKIFGITGLYTRPDICDNAIQCLGARYIVGNYDIGLLAMGMRKDMAQLNAVDYPTKELKKEAKK